jgi:tRNA pseudouridine32 synthase/23S rRNA pseudouridine746 synthase/23S rRNA pseudouridine1911/1915/1917 synthase
MPTFAPLRSGATGQALTKEDLLARILYRDALMLAIDKPAGIAVHSGPRGGPSLEDHFDALRFGLPRPPHLAHRLDRDTSGCLVLGRHKKALAQLGALFAEGAVEKVYWAVVTGAPPTETGTIDLALSKRSTRARGWWMEPDPTGQPAVTDYCVRGSSGGDAERFSWLELRPRSGRTHQIRVHLQALACPVVGDPVYGASVRGAKLRRLHLHARSVRVPLYPKREPIFLEAPVPSHMRELLEACGLRESADAS